MNRQTVEHLVLKIYNGVKGYSIKLSHDKEQAQDFLQEGMIAAMKAIEIYKNRPEDELIKLISKSAYNRILRVLREEVNWSRRFLTKTTTTEDDTILEDPITDICDYPTQDVTIPEMMERQFITMLKSRLSPLCIKILNEKLCPSKESVLNMELSRCNSKNYTNNGTIDESNIKDTHIAKTLNISKATMSRHLKIIQTEFSLLKDDQESICG